MIRSLVFILIAAAAILGAVWFADRPGFVTVDWLDYHFRLPVWLVILGVLLFAAICAVVYRMWKWLTHVPGNVAEWRQESKRERGYRALTQGMVAVAAGDAGEAQKQARRADVLLNEPPLTMLLSAQAAQLDGDDDAARRYFTAMLEREETAFLGLRGLLIQAQRQGNRAEALRLAGRARALEPKTPWVLSTLFDLQVEEGQWNQALNTLDDAAKRGAIDAAEARRLRTVVLLGCSHDAEETGDRTAARDFAKKARKHDPADLPATLRYAELLAADGRNRALDKLAREAWARTPHPELARLYMEAGGEMKPLAAVKRLEKLTAANRDHQESHIALARAHLQAEIWGAARSHLEKAAGDDPPARVCRLMAELEDRETGRLDMVRHWLMRAGTAAPDPVWICSQCGAQAGSWTPLCPRCHAPGSLDWRVPDHVHALVEGPDDDALAAEKDAVDAPHLPLASRADQSGDVDDPPPIPPRLVGDEADDADRETKKDAKKPG